MSDTQFSQQLPERPNLAQLKMHAESLWNDYRSGDPAAESMVGHYEENADVNSFQLQDAQVVLAKSYGFANWKQLRERILVDTIKRGDGAGLTEILQAEADPQELLTAKIELARPTNHAIGRGATLLQIASYRQRSKEAATVLLEKGAVVDVHSACGLGMISELEKILKADPGASSTQVDTYCPLQFAITAKRVEVVECLMQNGDDPN